jgi:hypothetical protein
MTAKSTTTAAAAQQQPAKAKAKEAKAESAAIKKAAAAAEAEEAAIVDVTDRLNAQARRLAARRGPELKPGDEDWGCIDMVNNGRTVFKKRIWPLMYVYWAYTAYGLLSAPSLPFLLVGCVACVRGYVCAEGSGAGSVGGSCVSAFPSTTIRSCPINRLVG